MTDHIVVEYIFDRCQRCGQVIESEKHEGIVRVHLPAACRQPTGCQAGRPEWDGQPREEGEHFALDGTAPDSRAPGGGHCVATGCEAEVPTGRDWCGRHFGLIPGRLRSGLFHAKSGIERERALTAAKEAVELAEFGKRLL